MFSRSLFVFVHTEGVTEDEAVFAFENGHYLAYVDEHDQQITHKHMKRKRNRSLVDFTRHQEESLCNCFLRLRSETSGQDLTHSPK